MPNAARAFGAPNIMMGTITIPDGTPPPDLNNILGNVFQSLGLSNVLNATTTAPDNNQGATTAEVFSKSKIL